MNYYSLFLVLIFLDYSFGIIYSKYSGAVTDYEVVLPRKLKPCGSFHSFRLSHFFDASLSRRKRSTTEEDEVHYKLRLGGTERRLKLRPNFKFVSPGAVVEHWHGRNLTDRKISSPSRHLCHFRGDILDTDGQAAVSLCSGIVGFVKSNGTLYFVEPLEDEAESGEQLHLVYKRSAATPSNHACDSSHDWVNSWAEEIYRNLKASYVEGNDETRARRSDFREVVPRYMDLCVVSDLKFIIFHKNRNVEEYVLSIMNMVADFYHDDSVGNLIDVVVVRLVFLHKEKEEMDLDISPNATTTLTAFCKWQTGMNPKDPNHPNHHDLAVLLTRHDICSEGTAACGLLGLAYVGTACNPTRNCCINEDTGLMLAATVAHELGHNMGCAHDSPEESGCEGKLPNGAGTVMSPAVGSLWSTTWSNCSREFITNLLLNQLGECLLDEPQQQNYQSPEMPIGAIYDADVQCQFSFGDDYIKCDIGGEKLCEELWCKKLGGSKCVSKGQLVADGTNCGPDHWCYGKECVPVGQRPPAIDGGWADWGGWTECTRTCGGGVSMRERLCTNPKPKNGGRYCTGIKRDYKICNTNDCPEHSSTFRESQCTSFDSKPFKGELYTWKPYPSPESDPNPCALYCLNEKATLVKLAPRVKDGTRCQRGKKDTCIHGTCVKVGCDWGIDSKAVEDICGDCNGDGTRCRVVNQVFNQSIGKGYVQITSIPRGSINIAISEQGTSENMIAIGSSEKNIYFNANSTEQPPGEYKIGGVFGIYTKPEKNREEFHIRGPLKEDIVLFYAYFEESNPGVKYKYSVPTSQPHHAPKYKWEFIEWCECSAKCGGGTQISKPTCVEVESGKVIEKYCNSIEKPDPISKSCNMQKCRTRWKTWAWGPCSGCMYKTGERRREVECVMELPSHADGDEIIVDESECCGQKPPSTELCNSSRPCNVSDPNFSNCTRRKRWEQELDMDFVRFSYDLTGVEDKINEICKRAPPQQEFKLLCNNFQENASSSASSQQNITSNSKCPNSTIVVDKIDPKTFVLKTVDLTGNNVDLLGNMSEQDFESVAAMVPQFSLDKMVTFTGDDAMHRFGKLGNENKFPSVEASVSSYIDQSFSNLTSVTSSTSTTTLKQKQLVTDETLEIMTGSPTSRPTPQKMSSSSRNISSTSQKIGSTSQHRSSTSHRPKTHRTRSTTSPYRSGSTKATCTPMIKSSNRLANMLFMINR